MYMNRNFTVRVHTKDGVQTFSNISPEHLDRIKEDFPTTRNKTTAHVQRGSLDELIAEGAKVTGLHDHDRSDTYSVYVRRPEDDADMIFTNVAAEHINELRKKYPEVDALIEQLQDPDYEEEEKEQADMELDEGEEDENAPEKKLVEALNMGEQVIRVTENDDGTCTVDLKTKEGKTDVIKDVDEDDVYEYIDNVDDKLVEAAEKEEGEDLEEAE
ncbi:hypothetical protein HDU96_007634 [Phlyctochytrium bullatum]|nr:hypothetical protein HDU96_007634 [Phlyctochytrium bullatum]